MKLNLIGFFLELEYGMIGGGSIYSAILKDPMLNENKIVEYLQSGLVFIGCPGISRDILHQDKVVIGSPNILTDGVWAWSQDLPYYIQKYHVDLPTTFITHIRNNNWKVPREDEICINDLEL